MIPQLSHKPRHAVVMSQLLMRIRLVCPLWNAVAISTPSLWVHLVIQPHCPLPPHILSIWLERSKTYHLCIGLDLTDEEESCPTSQILSVLGPSVPRWEILRLYVRANPAHLICDYLPLSRAIRLKSLYLNIASYRTPHTFFAHLGTIPNLKSFEFCPADEHTCGLVARYMKPTLSNLSHLCFEGEWEHPWKILQFFQNSGTILNLRWTYCPRFVPSITFSNLKVLHLYVSMDFAICLLSSFHLPALQLLDLDLECVPRHGFPEPGRFSNHFSVFEYSLQVLRISELRNADGLERLFQIPIINAIPLVEVIVDSCEWERTCKRDWSSVCGRTVRVELGTDHGYDEIFVGWNDLFSFPLLFIDYLSSDHVRPLHKWNYQK